MRFRLSKGHFSISLLNKLIITSLLSFIVSGSISLNQAVSEEGDIKKQIQELRLQMQQMQQKLEELEKKNMELETRAKKAEEEKKSEEELKQITQAPVPTEGFFQRTLQTLNPDISVIGLFSTAYYSTNNPPMLVENDPQNTGVNLQEGEIGFQSVVDPYFRFDSFISFTRQGGFEVEEIYGTSLFSLPLGLQIRGGVMRSKFGRINQIHRHNQDFVTLPLVAARFLAEHLNPTGVEANVLVPVPWFLELSASANSPYNLETPTFAPDEDMNNLGLLLYVFHVANFFEISDSLSLNLGGSFATGPDGTGEKNRSYLWGADVFAKYRPLVNNPYQELKLQSEVMARRSQTPDENLKDWGFYSEAVYRFAKRWNTGIRFGLTDTSTPVPIQPGDSEDQMLGLPGREYRISPMLTFSPTEFTRFKLEYDFTDPDFANKVSAIFLQFEWAIGAHGAHPF
jgi:hypothetical protein